MRGGAIPAGENRLTAWRNCRCPYPRRTIKRPGSRVVGEEAGAVLVGTVPASMVHGIRAGCVCGVDCSGREANRPCRGQMTRSRHIRTCRQDRRLEEGWQGISVGRLYVRVDRIMLAF